jgi:hypothetical protein
MEVSAWLHVDMKPGGTQSWAGKSLAAAAGTGAAAESLQGAA